MTGIAGRTSPFSRISREVAKASNGRAKQETHGSQPAGKTFCDKGFVKDEIPKQHEPVAMTDARGCTLHDLCSEDKEKVAKLLKQIVDLGQENRSLKDAAAAKDQAHAREVQQLHDRAQQLVQENLSLKGKIAQMLVVLRSYQSKVNALSKQQQQQQAVPAGPAGIMPNPDAAATALEPAAQQAGNGPSTQPPAVPAGVQPPPVTGAAMDPAGATTPPGAPQHQPGGHVDTSSEPQGAAVPASSAQPAPPSSTQQAVVPVPYGTISITFMQPPPPSSTQVQLPGSPRMQVHVQSSQDSGHLVQVALPASQHAPDAAHTTGSEGHGSANASGLPPHPVDPQPPPPEAGGPAHASSAQLSAQPAAAPSPRQQGPAAAATQPLSSSAHRHDVGPAQGQPTSSSSRHVVVDARAAAQECDDVQVEEVPLHAEEVAPPSPLLLEPDGPAAQAASSLLDWQVQNGLLPHTSGPPSKVLQYDPSIGRHGAFYFADVDSEEVSSSSRAGRQQLGAASGRSGMPPRGSQAAVPGSPPARLGAVFQGSSQRSPAAGEGLLDAEVCSVHSGSGSVAGSSVGLMRLADALDRLADANAWTAANQLQQQVMYPAGLHRGSARQVAGGAHEGGGGSRSFAQVPAGVGGKQASAHRRTFATSAGRSLPGLGAHGPPAPSPMPEYDSPSQASSDLAPPGFVLGLLPGAAGPRVASHHFDDSLMELLMEVEGIEGQLQRGGQAGRQQGRAARHTILQLPERAAPRAGAARWMREDVYEENDVLAAILQAEGA